MDPVYNSVARAELVIDVQHLIKSVLGLDSWQSAHIKIYNEYIVVATGRRAYVVKPQLAGQEVNFFTANIIEIGAIDVVRVHKLRVGQYAGEYIAKYDGNRTRILPSTRYPHGINFAFHDLAKLYCVDGEYYTPDPRVHDKLNRLSMYEHSCVNNPDIPMSYMNGVHATTYFVVHGETYTIIIRRDRLDLYKLIIVQEHIETKFVETLARVRSYHCYLSNCERFDGNVGPDIPDHQVEYHHTSCGFGILGYSSMGFKYVYTVVPNVHNITNLSIDASSSSGHDDGFWKWGSTYYLENDPRCVYTTISFWAHTAVTLFRDLGRLQYSDVLIKA